MKNVAFLMVAMALVACGKKNDAKSPWAQHDQNTFMLGCITTASQSTQLPITGDQAPTTYTVLSAACDCVLDVAMTRWAASDIDAHPEYVQQLVDDGTVSSCNQQAKQ